MPRGDDLVYATRHPPREPWARPAGPNHRTRAASGSPAFLAYMADPREIESVAALVQRLLRRLDGREQELRQLIAEEHERATVELFSDLDGVVGDEADQAFAKTRAGVETELVDRHLRELEQIEAARDRIRSGGFDTCADCGGPIGAARLEAILSATRCTDCQARREKYLHETRKLPA